MDKRLLFGRSRRKQWPRKTPSVVKMIAISGDPLKINQEVTSRLTTVSVISQMIEYFHVHFASYSAYEILGHWIAATFYTPFDALQVTLRSNQQANINLPPLLTMVIVPAVICYMVHYVVRYFLEEYRVFLALGKGGTPCTPMGMIKVTILGYFANVDVLDPPYIDPKLNPSRGKLATLPHRPGPRPIVKGVAPQRQFDQKSTEATFYQLSQILKDAAANDQNLIIATSYLEGHTDALKAVFDNRSHKVLDTDGEWDYEIAHPHRIDSSMHIVCHPEDCKMIIEAGWGEKHPLSSDALWWRYLHHNIWRKRLPVPPNLVLVYAPRTPAELRLVKSFIDAAIWFHKERDTCNRTNRGLLERPINELGATHYGALNDDIRVVGLDNRSNLATTDSDYETCKPSTSIVDAPSTCTLAAASVPLSTVPLAKSCA